MKLLIIAWLMAGLAAARAGPLREQNVFDLRIESSDKTLNGLFVRPQRKPQNDAEVYWATISSDDSTERFQIEDGTLKYISPFGEETYASSQLYDFYKGIPVISFRSLESSPNGFDHGYSMNGDGHLVWQESTEWWVCEVKLTGQKIKV